MDDIERMYINLEQEQKEIIEILEELNSKIYKSFLEHKDFEKYIEKKNTISRIKTYLGSVSFFVKDTKRKIDTIKEELDIIKERNRILQKAYEISEINYKAVNEIYEKVIKSLSH